MRVFPIFPPTANASMKTRVTLAVSAFFVLASGVIAFWALALFETEKKRSLSADSFVLASNIADELDAKLRTSHSALIAVSAIVPPKVWQDYEAAETFLSGQAALLALFDNGLFLVTPEGRLMGESPPRPKRRGEDVSAREYFHKTIETRRPYISKPYRSTHKPGEPALIMTAPVFDQGGTLIGLLYGSLDLLGSNILADMAKRRIGQSGYFYLADGRDTMISHPDQSRVMKPAPAPGKNPAFDRAVEGWEGTDETVTSNGMKVLSSVKRLKTTGWILGASLPLDEFYQPITEARRYFLWSTLIGTIVILVLVSLLIRRLILPLSNMTRQVRAMTVGDPGSEMRLNVVSGDEIGVLASAFNSMLDKLSRLNGELEQRVEQRTAQLEAANGELTQARDAADAANRAKSSFLAAMSHELRTPLNAILGFSRLMSGDEGATETQRNHLGIILKSGEHLLSLINSVLDLAKIEAGKITAEPGDVDLGELLTDTIEMLRMRAEAKGLRLALDQSSSFPRFVNTDAAKLRQIIINLVGNAIKFTERGEISIKLSVLSQQSHDGNLLPLLFEISDTGPGIAPGDVEHLFKPFAQAHHKKLTEGTGLGLSIAKEYVKLLGGSISVESDLGKGSTFRFNIACHPVDSAHINALHAPDTRIEAIENATACRILVVEDQPDNRQLLQSLLEPFGFQYREALNGEEAIAIARDWQPQVILMDRRMPVMDGLSATLELRKLALEPKPIIIAVTAHAYREERQEMLDAGCDSFLRKPYHDRELFDLLAQHLDIRIRYVSATPPQETDIRPLSPESFAGIAQDLRGELEHAITLLDTETIENLIARISRQDPILARQLKRQADDFAYRNILNALQQAGGSAADDIRGETIENAANCRILVVEDDADNRELLKALLERSGFRHVREAVNGQDAIAAARDWHPHVILMDHRMPVMDGPTAARELGKMALEPKPVIIAVTGNGDGEEHREMLDAGCASLLAKPFRGPDLFALLARHLGVSAEQAAPPSPAPDSVAGSRTKEP